MEFTRCTEEDIPLMLDYYDLARNLQQEKSDQHWNSFDPETVRQEIKEGRQWKILEGNEMACIFLVAYEDPFIWGARNADPAVYLHRIVTHPDFRGKNYTQRIVDWARAHATANNCNYVRMDTWGDNPKLVAYYQQCGFTLLETVHPQDFGNLPSHYNCISLALLEIKLS